MGFAVPPGSALGTDRNTASGLHFSKWVLSASRAGESSKEITECLSGSGKSRSLLTALSASSTPCGRSWGIAALAAHNCRWLLVPCSGETKLLPAPLRRKGKRGCKGQEVTQRLKSEKRIKVPKKPKQNQKNPIPKQQPKKKKKEKQKATKQKTTHELSCIACGHMLIWSDVWCWDRIYDSRLKDFFGFASVVALIPQGKAVCLVWFLPSKSCSCSLVSKLAWQVKQIVGGMNLRMVYWASKKSN